MAPTFEQRGPLMQRLWDSMDFDPGQKPSCMAAAKRILTGKTRYSQITAKSGIPWWFVGIIHMMESNCNFGTHLHNGDSLKAKTWQVPAGRPPGPPSGPNGSYTWEESALDALTMPGKKFDKVVDWSVAHVLYLLELYNGFGYVRTADYSPYLWARTTVNDGTGKYVRDGVYDQNANADGQVGAAALLKCLMELDPTVVPGPRPMTPKEIAGTTAAGVGGAVAAGGAIAVTASKPPATTTENDGHIGIYVGAALFGAIVLGTAVLYFRSNRHGGVKPTKES